MSQGLLIIPHGTLDKKKLNLEIMHRIILMLDLWMSHPKNSTCWPVHIFRYLPMPDKVHASKILFIYFHVENFIAVILSLFLMNNSQK